MNSRPRVLMVDDDEHVLTAAKRVLRQSLEIETARNAVEGIRALKERGPFAVVVSDYNMPSVNGATFLAQAHNHWPQTARILLTGAADQSAAIDAVNNGHIHCFLRKPCEPAELLEAVQAGARQYDLARAERELLENTLSGSIKMLMEVLALAAPETSRRAQLVRRWAKPAAQALNIGPIWEVDVAASVWPLGDMALPSDLLRKRSMGMRLTAEEQKQLDQSPFWARDLIANIPRLSGVAQAVYYSQKHYNGGGIPRDGRSGADIPPIARLLHILIDLADFGGVTGVPTQDGWRAIKENIKHYDADFLPVIEKALGSCALDKRKAEPITLKVEDICESDRLAEDIHDSEGRLVLAAGAEISALIRRKLLLLWELGKLHGNVEIWRAGLSR